MQKKILSLYWALECKQAKRNQSMNDGLAFKCFNLDILVLLKNVCSVCSSNKTWTDFSIQLKSLSCKNESTSLARSSLKFLLIRNHLWRLLHMFFNWRRKYHEIKSPRNITGEHNRNMVTQCIVFFSPR